MDYNVQYEELDIDIIAGDTISLTYSVYLNDALYDMSGMRLDAIIRNDVGTAIKTLSSSGDSPAITISTSTFNISTTAITTPGWYKYAVQLTNGTTVSTILKGNMIIEDQTT